VSGDRDGLREFVEAFTAGLRRAPEWSAITLGAPNHGFANDINAGRHGELSWFQQTADGARPAIFVVGEMALLIDRFAVKSLEWSRSLTALDKRLAGRWVRVPLAIVQARDPTILPISMVAQDWQSTDWATARQLPSADTGTGVLRFAIGAQEYEVDAAKPALQVTGWTGTLQITYECQGSPFPLPAESEIVDGRELGLRELSPAEVAAADDSDTARYSITVTQAEGEDGQDHRWVLQDYDLAAALDVPHNVVAERVVLEAVHVRRPDLVENLKFDSEEGCFFAYADTLAAANGLADLIAELVQERAGRGQS
jgi:Immunity protein 51